MGTYIPKSNSILFYSQPKRCGSKSFYQYVQNTQVTQVMANIPKGPRKTKTRTCRLRKLDMLLQGTTSQGSFDLPRRC